MRAGLIPALAAGALPGSQHWQILLFSRVPTRSASSRISSVGSTRHDRSLGRRAAIRSSRRPPADSPRHPRAARRRPVRGAVHVEPGRGRPTSVPRRARARSRPTTSWAFEWSLRSEPTSTRSRRPTRGSRNASAQPGAGRARCNAPSCAARSRGRRRAPGSARVRTRGGDPRRRRRRRRFATPRLARPHGDVVAPARHAHDRRGIPGCRRRDRRDRTIRRASLRAPRRPRRRRAAGSFSASSLPATVSPIRAVCSAGDKWATTRRSAPSSKRWQTNASSPSTTEESRSSTRRSTSPGRGSAAGSRRVATTSGCANESRRTRPSGTHRTVIPISCIEARRSRSLSSGMRRTTRSTTNCLRPSSSRPAGEARESAEAAAALEERRRRRVRAHRIRRALHPHDCGGGRVRGRVRRFGRLPRQRGRGKPALRTGLGDRSKFDRPRPAQARAAPGCGERRARRRARARRGAQRPHPSACCTHGDGRRPERRRAPGR